MAVDARTLVPESFTPAWVQAALAVEHPGVEVRDVAIEPAGTGQIAATYRITPDYGKGPRGPATLVLKCPPAEPAARSVATRSGSYRVEIEFYRQMASQVDVRVPRCWGSDCPDDGDFLLLLEDAAPAVQGDQLAGCSVVQAEAAIDEIVGLHVPYWDRLDETMFPWMRRRRRDFGPAMVAHLPDMVDGYYRLFEGRVPEATTALRDHLADLLVAYLSVEWELHSLVHGDYRIDNLMFGEPGVRPIVVDWGGLAEGPPVSDVSYFVGGSLVTADRRAAEEHLVRRYHEGITARGASGMSWDELWRQYVMHAPMGLVISVLAPQSVQRTERGDRMFLTLTERHCQQVLDLGTLDLLLPR